MPRIPSGSVALFVVVLSAVACGQSGMLSPNSGNGWVVVPDAADLEPVSTITVEAWFKYDPAAPWGANYPTIVRKNSTNTHPYFLRVQTGISGFEKVQWAVLTGTTGTTVAESTAPFVVNVWHHLAGTYDGATMKMYLDGVLIDTEPKTGALVQTVAPLLLGGGNGTGETFKGFLDEIRIWNVARTAAQIQDFRFVKLDSGAGLIGAWHFDGSFADSVGGHGGAAVGGATIAPSTSPVIGTYLTAPISASSGTAVPYALAGLPFAPYFLETTFAGASPGAPLPAPAVGTIPLNPPFLHSQFGPYLPGLFQNYVGFFDAAGNASAVLDLPDVAGYVGAVFTSAFVVIDPASPFAVGSISNPVATAILNPPPIVTAVSPTSGYSIGGATATISGSGFHPAAVVKFDGVPATNVTVTPTSIACTVPSGVPGFADVSVHNPDGVGTLPDAFQYVQALVVSSVAPLDAAPGAAVVVTGNGFQPGTSVEVDGIPAVVLSATPTVLQYVQPAGFGCDAPLTIATPDGQSAQTTVNPAPVVAAVVGGSGPAIGGGTIIVVGSHFAPGVTVSVGGVPAPVTASSSTVIFATAPPGTPGLATAAVSQWGCSASFSYTYN
jgi:hypothetical protein